MIPALIILAQATQPVTCLPRDHMTAWLAQNHGEAMIGAGLGANGILFASPEGSWTVIQTDAEGLSCIAAFGEAWIDASAVAKGEPL